jgi:hypothetical protein
MKPCTHFRHTIDHLDAVGEIIETIAGVDDFEIAETTWLAAVKRWPREQIMLRQGAWQLTCPLERPACSSTSSSECPTGYSCRT